MFRRLAASLLATLALCALAAHAAEWQITQPNVMTIAMGVSIPNDVIYVTGSDNGTGARIMRSFDNAATWEDIKPGNEISLMTLAMHHNPHTNTTTGIAAGIGMYQIFNGMAAAQDNGDTFETIGEPVFVAGYQASGVTPSGTIGVVGMWSPNVREPLTYGIRMTNDNGQTFTDSTWPLEEAPIRYASFPSDDVWYATGGTWPTSTSGRMAGKHHHGGARHHAPRDPTRKSAMLNEFFKFRTVRGNQAIEYLPTSTDPAAHAKDLANYVGVIAKTTDGGRTFNTVFHDVGNFYMNGIDCPSVDHCVAVAEGPAGGHIFVSDNGGASWNQTYTHPEAGLFKVAMVSETHGWAIGGEVNPQTFNGLFLSTEDGGFTWTQAPLVPHVYVNDVACTSMDNCVATAFHRNGQSVILQLA